MREFKQCVEREKIVFNVEVKDPNAPVEFFKNGEKIVPDGERVEVKNLGNGKHQLVINKVGYKTWFFFFVLRLERCNAFPPLLPPLPLSPPSSSSLLFLLFLLLLSLPPPLLPLSPLPPPLPPPPPPPPRPPPPSFFPSSLQAEMGDAGNIVAKTPTNRGDEIAESKSNFSVAKGEEAPVMGDVGPITGVAKMQCNMTVPYKVEGEKQSDLEIFVEKDGKQLKIGKDIQVKEEKKNNSPTNIGIVRGTVSVATTVVVSAGVDI